jgi:CRISPR-associated endonuclease/helicase Cas3
MRSDRLWAKSWDDADGPTPSHVFLAGHLADVYEAASRVLDCTADDQLRAVGLETEEWRDRFRRIVLLAAAVHDLGKANDHFQGMIIGKRDVRLNPQGLRHEWVTLLMLQRLHEWVSKAVAGNEVDLTFVEWAVVGHHPAQNHCSPPTTIPLGAGPEITLLMGHDDFRTALAILRSTFQLGEPPTCSDLRRNLVGPDNVFNEINAIWFRASQRVWDGLRKSEDRRLVAAVKNCLIAADVAGSALPKAKPHDHQRWNWITDSFAAMPQPGDLQAVVDYRLNGGSPHLFQSAVANSRSRVTYVKAGCGSGKTLAAYLWAATNYPERRLYFCYPTTGTATEGFKDYLFDASAEIPRIGAKLFHSRRDIDLEIILTTGRDTARPDTDEFVRLDALEAWATPVVACTVDTVLGLIQNNRRGLFAWPALAQSAFVFDEIHAFDDRLFGALLRFLRDLSALPVLLMTASLPTAREDALRAAVDSQGMKLNPIPGPPELENRKRYRKETVIDDDALPVIRKTLSENGKVLWVCNTIGRVMDAASRAKDLSPLLYHSRFKYEDRVQRHKAVIEAFKLDGAALAICSQVAEMSLDLSADLLVTDLATVPALIQRLGRLNRRAKEGDPTRPFVVIDPKNPLPYTVVELEAAQNWLAKLPNDGVSQSQLANAWEQIGDQPPEAVASAWLDGGPRTTVTELRKPSPGITVLMESDLQQVKANPKDLARFVLPMPPCAGWEGWPRERGVPIAPSHSIIYDRLRGAEWQK